MEQSITIARANDRTLRISVTKDDVAYDITGFTIFFTVKRKLTDPDVDAVIAKDAVINDAPNGLAYVELTNDETDIPERAYSYDAKIKDTFGKVQNSCTGALIIRPRVTIRES